MTPTQGIDNRGGHVSQVHHQESELSPPEGLGGVARARDKNLELTHAEKHAYPNESVSRTGSDSDTGGTP
jgi:hypothetical protein